MDASLKVQGIECQVIRRARRKTASLQVSPSNEVSVIVPADLSDDRIAALVRRKIPWILGKIKFNNEVSHPRRPKEFISGEAIQYLGRNYRLKVVRGGAAGVELRNGRFMVGIPAGTADGGAAVRSLLIHWFARHAEIRLRERVRRFEALVGVQCGGIGVKDLRRRWGSCGRDGMIRLNWRIIIAPMSIVDYVVAHELCHRVHHDHSKEFWALMAMVMPDYPERKEWLRVNGALLDL